MKPMSAKFPSKCAGCGQRIEAGAAIMYDKAAPKGRKAWHPTCAAQRQMEQPQQSSGPAPAPSSSFLTDTAARPIFVRHWDSVAAFVQSQPHEEQRARWDKYNERHRPGDRWAFGEARTAEVLTARITTGWPEAVDRIDAMGESMEPPAPVSTRRRARWADQGDALDIHRVYSGQLSAAWRRTRRDSVRAPAPIRIAAMVAGSCGQKEAQFFWRGAAVIRLADALTAAGYSVEVLAVAPCVGFDDASTMDGCQFIPLKHRTAPLDKALLASVLCQVGFVRYHLFRNFLAHDPKEPGPNGAPMGRGSGVFGFYPPDGVELETIARTAMQSDVTGMTLILADYAVDSPEKAERWIADQLARIEDSSGNRLAA